MRNTISQAIDPDKIINRIHQNLQSLSHYCILNSNSGELNQVDEYSTYDLLVGINAMESLSISENSFAGIQNFYDRKKDWIFGFLTYELKDEIEDLLSANPDRVQFPKVNFFQPEFVLKLKGDVIYLDYLKDHCSEKEAKIFLDNILKLQSEQSPRYEKHSISSLVEKKKYIETIKKIQEHIHRGDIYEINFCTEFYSENINIDPVNVYDRMNTLSPMPFSAVFHSDEYYALCASPERFIAKRKNKIISQPIKGTARRGNTKAEDLKIIEQLRSDPKERAENVMIVDLVRNDLSKTAQKGSVKVERLFGISSFSNLHQMVSTISSLKREDVGLLEVIRQAFPMGSMTGAPKVRAMQLIEEFEQSKRGLYSGSIGYIDPNEDFDFNVVIRSILYNAKKSSLSFMVGSAITANADPEKEYFECLLKAENMKKALSGSKYL
jgi:para-aminobenzoate synthetase component 1